MHSHSNPAILSSAPTQLTPNTHIFSIGLVQTEQRELVKSGRGRKATTKKLMFYFV